MLTALAGFVVGVFVTAILANRKPDLFARVVKVATDIETKVTDATKK
jgi:hypothetical protein